jgi:hypothetical protein
MNKPSSEQTPESLTLKVQASRERKDKLIEMMEQEPLDLPTSQQLANFYHLRHRLQSHGEVDEVDTLAFSRLVLGTGPENFDIAGDDLNPATEVCPEEWDRFCEWEWGSPEDRRKIEEERLIAEG